MSKLKGSYLLVLHLSSAKKIRIGKLGEILFQPGYYTYTGSAMNSMEKRIKRHFLHDKKMWWHVDYLTVNAEPLYALAIPDEKVECSLGKGLSAIFTQIRDFGCSDCKCSSHLFFSKEDPGETIFKVVDEIGLKSKKIICYRRNDLE